MFIFCCAVLGVYTFSMNDIQKQSAEMLAEIMGQRLAKRREAAGYASAHDAWQAMVRRGLDISYFRYSSLELGGMPRNVGEMWSVAGFLGMDVGCWMEGVCELDDSEVSDEVNAMFSDIHRYSVGLARRLGL